MVPFLVYRRHSLPSRRRRQNYVLALDRPEEVAATFTFKCDDVEPGMRAAASVG